MVDWEQCAYRLPLPTGGLTFYQDTNFLSGKSSNVTTAGKAIGTRNGRTELHRFDVHINGTLFRSVLPVVVDLMVAWLLFISVLLIESYPVGGAFCGNYS